LSFDTQPLLRNLIKGCLKNDRKSQRNLYQHFYAYGLSICLRYSDNRDEAVELLNEAFMKTFMNLKKFDLSKSFTPWLRKILINTCINNFRKKKIGFTTELGNNHDRQVSEDILSGISYQEILGMIRKLSPAYRAVFNLYVIEGYKHEEIAKMLDISVGTSKSNLAKAKMNMRTILREYFHEDYERSK
jgi:RNA polymerase sigma factor (sigma-70 family)